MKKYKIQFRSKCCVWLAVLLALLISQNLFACGSVPNETPVSAATILPTIQPTPSAIPITLNTCKINVGGAKLLTPEPETQIEEARQLCVNVLDRSLQKWKAKNVAGYEITVSYHGTFFAPVENYTYTVKNGKIVQQTFEAINNNDRSGTPKPIKSSPTYGDGRELTIDGLFEEIRLRTGTSPWYEGALFEATFDPEYGYPRSFSLDSIRYTDSEYSWDVTSMKFNP